MKRLVAVLAALFAVALAFVTVTSMGDTKGAQPTMSGKVPPAMDGDFPSLAGATGWLNSKPLRAADLRGKVVLVNVWTYTCINWLRTLPYVRAWAERYKDRGLVVIGVHSPEFPFEHDVDNVRAAARDMHVDYPIALDNDFSIWNAFHNQYWPALYIIDARGRIRHFQFGEGGYEESERVIQKLLEEAGQTGIDHRLVTPDAHGAEVAADWASLSSPESYLGYGRSDAFASPGGATRDERRAYAFPARLAVNRWALSGDWTIGDRAARLEAPGGRVAYRFHARDLHLVMGAGTAGGVRFRLLLDGKPPGADHGADVDADGRGAVRGPRLYQLIRQTGPVADRELVIELLDPGVELFAFTFG